jgi:hypothetical protein
MDGQVVRIGEVRSAYTVLVGKLYWKRTLENHRHRWENNIRIDLSEVGWEGVDWIHLA